MTGRAAGEDREMRVYQSAVAALFAVALSGCSMTASPADGLSFQAPPGWQSSPGIMGFMQFWRSPSDDREVLMLFKSPKPLKAEDIFSDAQLKDTVRNATVEQRSAIEICGHQPATFVQARGSTSRGGIEFVDAVLTTLRGSSYLAMYVRPISRPTNPMAEAALRELCTKP
jgi:hypothetical protein